MSNHPSPSRLLLRSGVSAAALAAAWALPHAAEAQTCQVGAGGVAGVAGGTLVACPGGTELTFPGANPVGPFTVPNGSILTGVINGTTPTHQLWSYTFNGNATSVFLQGDYNLQGGIGGATELQGSSILSFAGAGACGAGGQVCPGVSGNGVEFNVSTFGGGGVLGGFVLPDVQAQPGTGGLPDYSSLFTDGQFAFTGPQTNAITVFDADGNVAGVYVQDLDRQELIEEEGLTEAEADARIAENDRLDELRREGHAPAVFIEETVCDAYPGGGCAAPGWGLDVMVEFDPVVVDQLEDCNAAGGSCVVILLPDSSADGAFRYGPVLDTTSPDTGGVPPASDSQITITGTGFHDSLFTDPNGLSVFFASSPAIDPVRIATLLEDHTVNSAVLMASNTTGDAGAGVQGSFSVPGADDRFLFTGLVGGNQGSYVVSWPVAASASLSALEGLGGAQVLYENSYLDSPVVVTPGRNASGVSPNTSFVVTFQEPMDRASVEEDFVLQQVDDRRLLVSPVEVTDVSESTRIWDKDAFDIQWNSDDTEVSFTFREEPKAFSWDGDDSKVEFTFAEESDLPSTGGAPEFLVTFTDDGEAYEPPIAFQPVPATDPGGDASETSRALSLLFLGENVTTR